MCFRCGEDLLSTDPQVQTATVDVGWDVGGRGVVYATPAKYFHLGCHSEAKQAEAARLSHGDQSP